MKVPTLDDERKRGGEGLPRCMPIHLGDLIRFSKSIICLQAIPNLYVTTSVTLFESAVHSLDITFRVNIDTESHQRLTSFYDTMNAIPKHGN